jgi:putative ABC transport system ATP-binding protein
MSDAVTMVSPEVDPRGSGGRGAHVVLSGVTRRYQDGSDPGRVVGVADIDLTIPSGRFVAIQGPSGSGKSTLLNLMAALDRPDDGRLTVDGVDLGMSGARALARYRRDHVGVVFQDSYLLPELSVAANIAMPAALARRARRDIAGRVEALLDDLDLADLADRMPSQLSGGQRQRVAVARALVNQPGLLLADEPTGSLDTQHGQQVVDLLEQANLAGATVVLVTHDHAVAARARDHIHLVDGRLVGDP